MRGRAGYFSLLREQPALVPIMLIVVFVMMGMGMVSPVLAVYAATFDVSTTEVGLMITGFGIARLIVDLPAGMLSERIGRRPLLWGGPLLMALASVGGAFASTFGSLLAMRCLQGAGSAIYITGALAAVADLSTMETRGRAMALYQSALLFGAGVGPVIGGIASEHFGYTAPFWGFAIVTAIATGLALWRLKETQVRTDRPSGHGSHRGSFALLAQSSFMAVSLVTFATFFTRTASTSDLIPLIGHDRLGLGADLLGLALAVSAAANLAALPFAGRLIDDWGRRPTVMLAGALACIALIAIGLSDSNWLFWSGIILLGLANGCAAPATAAFVADHAEGHQFGVAMGLVRTFGDAGFVAGPVAVGLMVDFTRFGYAGGLVLNAAIVLGTTMLFAFTTRVRVA